jgi:nucleotide-binding universal stress UspA family protein
MYKKILVPLDGSKRAEMILPHVEDLASRYQATVILLTAIEYNLSFSIEGTFIESVEIEYERIQEKTETYLKKIAKLFAAKKIKTETRLAAGGAIGAIIATASKENVDLIAMASHGRGALSRVFYGSVASGVLNRVDRPLLIVRSRKTH